MIKKYTPILLLMVFIMPIFASILFYCYYSFFHFRTNNHGTLITPPLMLQADPEKKWQIILIPDVLCDADCKKILYSLQQMQKLLGQDVKRVQIQCMKEDKQLLKSKIYLVDPLGNGFMYYSATVNPLDILKDLKQVLKVSQIG